LDAEIKCEDWIALAKSEMQRYRTSIVGVSKCRWDMGSAGSELRPERLSSTQVRKMMLTKVE